MPVLKIKDSNGKWIEVPFITPNMPTKVSDLNNDLNYQTKEQVEELIPNVDNFVTTEELNNGLNTKQNKGDYATNSRVNQVENSIPTQVSELQNDSNYATQTQVMQAIASIPQFSISLVESLPTTGEKMVLYLVSKGGESPDVYDEYIWIEQTSSFEFLGTTAVDLTGYVKNTDYATSSKAGLMRPANGLYMSGTTGAVVIAKASEAQINAKKDNYYPIVSSTVNYAVNTVFPTKTQAEYKALVENNEIDENLFYMIVEG